MTRMNEAARPSEVPGPACDDGLVLSVRALEVEYTNGAERFRALRGVSFDVARGQKLAVVGESGCGKSTLALALLRLVESSGRIVGGDIAINGRSILGLRDRELERLRGREAAIVFQDPSAALDPVKRVGRQVMEVLETHNPDLSNAELRRRATEVLESTEIPAAAKRFDAYPHELSGGLRQRVVIAIAVANAPSLLIADEPTSALDVTTQAQIMDMLDRLVRERRIAVTLLTHNLGVVAEFCDSVAVMYAGRIVEHSDVDSVFRSPAHPYTEALLRCIPRPRITAYEPLPSLPGFPPKPRTSSGWVHVRAAVPTRVGRRHLPVGRSVATPLRSGRWSDRRRVPPRRETGRTSQMSEPSRLASYPLLGVESSPS
jgi:ABC-type dipeptide/oligopeptide/nickel transport system ATPase component